MSLFFHILGYVAFTVIAVFTLVILGLGYAADKVDIHREDMEIDD